MGVARPFYVLSQSFTKYLVERIGLHAVVGLAGGADPEAELRQLTGREAASWRADWLDARVRCDPPPIGLLRTDDDQR